ncbi:hypothetical protein LTR08_005267 [Meristemomyces frigidus]|nr:hypothetical protein LTR08_005267 [Meristemomyces frigidus]
MVQGVHLGQARPDDGHFSTIEVREREEPCLSTSRLIAFRKNQYTVPANLAAGFSSLDISCEGPIRANLIADSITTSAFRIAVETWGHSTLFEAGATWIEHKATAKDCVFGQFDTQDLSEAPAASATAPRAKTTKRHLVLTEPVPRKYGKPFFFPKAFREPPEVVCWLNRLDLASGMEHNYKVRAFADGVDAEGFTAHLNTWDDGELNGAAMCWIAFPRGKRHVDSGRFSTNDVRKRTNPRPKTTGKVKFKQRFDQVPTVLAALNTIDAAANADLRVKVSVSEVDREGFRWNLETWDDSTLYSAGASWIALGFT